MHRKKIAISIMILSLCGVLFVTYGKKDSVEKARSICGEMPIEQKIGQRLMIALPGKSMNLYTESILKNYHPGGVVFFGYNIADSKGLSEFTAALQSASIRYSKVPMFISIDQEGGRVGRIIDGVTQFPGNMAAGIVNDEKLVYQWGRILGLQLRSLGINMNLAPVLDVNNNPDNPVINTRSFGADVDVVSDLGVSYMKGLQESRCISVGKHFPGHGDTNTDSHLSLPVIHYDMDRLNSVELAPFDEAVDSGIDGIMTAHIAFPEILGNNDSATISRFFLTEVLREKMGFNGIIITDDMEMNAISREHDMGEAAIRTVLAGSDVVLFSSFGPSLEKISKALINAVKTGRISEDRINESVKRIIEMKIRYGIASVGDSGIVSRPFLYTGDDVEELKNADEINRQLSFKSICFRGDEELLKIQSDRARIIVTHDENFSKYLVPGTNDMILSSLAQAENEIRRIPAGMKKVIYVHITGTEPALIKKSLELNKKCGAPCVAVVSGNPFPVVGSGIFQTVLMSFSGTEVSLEMLARACNGEFSPVEEKSLFPERK